MSYPSRCRKAPNAETPTSRPVDFMPDTSAEPAKAFEELVYSMVSSTSGTYTLFSNEKMVFDCPT